MSKTIKSILEDMAEEIETLTPKEIAVMEALSEIQILLRKTMK